MSKVKHEAAECSICSQNTTRYIEILGGYICKACEREISNLDMKDKKYEVYNILMKKMWREFLTAM
ncbi:sigma factor G inhibitor Gin [Anaerosolibacter carboniphilus]|uniref:sigma factor G inhibitor Gin n=1 Tax=Anaerosolibacter carboniphilus TaxID=1417629 RepID=UPI0038CBF706